MSDNIENRRQTRRISSILKNVGGSGSGRDSPTETFSRHSKRISFSHVNNVKEFVAVGNNQTIWGESYEKSHTVKDTSSSGSNSGSVSQTATISDSTAAILTPAVDFIAPKAPKIALFGDIESSTEEDVEMEISSDDSRSPTKLFNQTMFIEDPSVSASTTSSKIVDMSTVSSNTNKRKTSETILVNKVIREATTSIKIRKMNNENLDPAIHNTILQPVNMSVSILDRKSVIKPHTILNTTQISNADLSDADGVPESEALLHSDVGLSEMLNKTLIAATDITIDDQSFQSSNSATSKPICNKTHIYNCGDISAGIDQTFAVRNPLQDNNATRWNAIEKCDESSDKQISKDYEMENVVPVFQPDVGNSRYRTFEDLTISMDIQFKNHSFSSHSLNPDEPVIEDLTIFLDTNFKADISDENESIMKSTNDSMKENNSMQQGQQENIPPHRTGLSIKVDVSKENVSASGTALPPINYSIESTQNPSNSTTKIPKDTTISSTKQPEILSPTSDIRFDLVYDQKPKTESFDGSISHDPVAVHDFTFGNSEPPLSSTRFLPHNKLSLNFSDTNKINSSSVTFSDCPTLAIRRSVASLQNNTDELCHLEPDQLRKRSEMKKLFLSLSQESNDMLTETKMDLVDTSLENECKESSTGNQTSKTRKESLDHNFVSNEPVKNSTEFPCNGNVLAMKEEINKDVVAEPNDMGAEFKTEVYNQPRCRKCLNCRKSLDQKNTSFLKKDPSAPPKLDLSIYDQFKGLATMRDVFEAHKKRQAAREAEEQLLVDPDIESPDIRFLFLNQDENENTEKPQPEYEFEPLICFPLRMNIKYLMRNKMRTEYTQWKYNDNFFYIGAIALRNEKIPSIRIHIKFDAKGPMKAEELNMPLLFNRVFIEECPTYLKRISAGNFLKHKEALAMLPLNLTTIISDSENIYRGLDEIEKCFQSVVAKVNEIDALTVEHDAFFKLENGQCSIEKVLFDTKKYSIQEIRIKLDKVDTVGPSHVFFNPFCETNSAFKTSTTGLPFLRSFLMDPITYLLPSADG